MRAIRLIALSLLVLVSDFAYSQTVDEVRRVKATALEVFDKYVAAIGLLYENGTYEEDNFMELFSSDALIYNDIIPDSTSLGKMIVPSEYISILRETVFNYKVEFRELKLSFPSERDSTWIINCSFDQTFYYVNGKNSLMYPRHLFKKIIRISMDKHREDALYSNARIESVNIDKENNGEVLSDYFVVQNVDSLNLRIKSSTYEDKLFPSPLMPQDVNVPQLGYFQKLTSENSLSDSRFYRFHLKNRNILSTSLVASPIAKGFRIDNSLLPNVDQSAFAIGANTKYGMQIGKIKTSTLFLNFGLGIDYYKNKLDGTWNTSYRDVDIDGDEYLRKISVSSFNENSNMLSLNVPITMECLILIEKAKKPMFVSLEGGVYAGYRITSQSMSLDARYTGTYDYFNGVEFDHYYDYGAFKMTDSDVEYSLPAKKSDVGVLLNIGVARELTKDKLLKLSLGYQHGFTALSKTSSDFYLTKKSQHYTSPMETSSKGLTNMNIGISFIKILK